MTLQNLSALVQEHITKNYHEALSLTDKAFMVNKNTEMEQRLKELKVSSTLAIRLAVAFIENLATEEKISSKTLSAVRKGRIDNGPVTVLI